VRLDELVRSIDLHSDVRVEPDLRLDRGVDPDPNGDHDLIAVDPLAAIEVTRVDFDSRSVQDGSLFCCVRGEHVDGHDFARAAVAKGARALLVDHPLTLDGSTAPMVAQLRVDDVRATMAYAAAAVSGDPSRGLTVIGITGTNGKTTTTFLLRNVFAEAGRSADVLGTLSGARTTPEAPDLQRWLAGRRGDGVDTIAMEVSSHALSLHRVDATWFRAAVFTNLSRDHLDFHGTMESYFEAKARLFTPKLAERAIVNLDDPYGRLLRDASTVPTVGYSLDDVDALVVGAAASTFRWRGHDVVLPIGGRFNVSNALAAAETAHVMGVDPAVIAAGLGRPLAVPGRFEAIDEGQDFRVIVDFAHTPDALEQVLRAAREVAGEKRVHLLFGCGGDRDRSKRPAMGEVAARLAHRVVLTADNSRHEATADIIDAVQQGFRRVPTPQATDLLIEPDRRAAILLALGGASAGDVVVLAGKGHETTQTIGETITHFDDREVAQGVLRDLLGRSGAPAAPQSGSGSGSGTTPGVGA